ncbi:MAG: hypothetical protein ACREDY_05535 [Bradyrhizobium sp.]
MAYVSLFEKKKTKQEVEYGPGHARGDHCGICEHFQRRAKLCEVVQGEIHAMDWCRLFVKKRAD